MSNLPAYRPTSKRRRRYENEDAFVDAEIDRVERELFDDGERDDRDPDWGATP